MSIVELIPLNKGNHIILDNTKIITIGRTPNIGCLDNKISRNHAQLFIKIDGTIWIKPIHQNPIFYKTKTNQIVTLTKDKEYQLYNNDQFGLLPDEYFYRVSIKLNNAEINQTENNIDVSSTNISTSSVSDTPLLTSDNDKELNEEGKTINTPLVEEQACKYQDTEKKEPKADESIISSTAVQTNTSDNQTASSSTTVVESKKREQCPYGESCFRKNLIHRQEVSHPGDPDWESKENDKNTEKPDCPYGNECYRTNTDHLNEYRHPKKRCIEINTKSRTTKRKASEDKDDDDGLPNEYDYNDSFIDDEDTDTTNDEKESIESDGDIEWKPEKNSRNFDETDDYSSDESDRELRKKEATEFIQSSTSNHHNSKNKKPRLDDETDEDDS
ncbi:unnamed protein product [Adineta steineri]|uniref:Aprataxin and PNK-like factor n=1 Tax=Adineta steineri TaxID=433720 RepID=A0A815EP22_9BILA|nr:unnamed protein product [Adineta steineri]CAF3623833.1 unnamed protein product [Adineta steineri]